MINEKNTEVRVGYLQWMPEFNSSISWCWSYQ